MPDHPAASLPASLMPLELAALLDAPPSLVLAPPASDEVPPLLEVVDALAEVDVLVPVSALPPPSTGAPASTTALLDALGEDELEAPPSAVLLVLSLELVLEVTPESAGLELLLEHPAMSAPATMMDVKMPAALSMVVMVSLLVEGAACDAQPRTC